MVLSELESLAKYGLSEAQLILGVLYENGFGVKIDEAKALEFYTTAMLGGNILAQRCTANLLIKLRSSSDKIAKGICLLRDAAQKGDVSSQLDLAYYYQLNKLSVETFSEILDWAKKAADSGYAPAAAYLGYMYQFGRGVTIDENFAFKWYLRAAELGEADAAASVGKMYKDGKGVEKNDQKALEWINVGITKSSSVAHRILSAAYWIGQLGLPIDPNKAKEHGRLATELLATQMSQDRKNDALPFVQPPLLL